MKLLKIINTVHSKLVWYFFKAYSMPSPIVFSISFFFCFRFIKCIPADILYFKLKMKINLSSNSTLLRIIHQCSLFPSIHKTLTNVGSTLAHRLRCWTNLESALGERCYVFIHVHYNFVDHSPLGRPV